jgi:HEAT repeat protein
MNNRLHRAAKPHRRRSRLLLPSLLMMISGCGSQPPYEGKTVDELTRMLRDADPTVQSQGAYGLSRLGAEAAPATPALIDALRDNDVDVRRHAALALGEIGPAARAAVPALTELLRDGAWTVRRQAAVALGRIGPEAQSAVPALEKLIREDADDLVRKAAQQALAVIRK